MLKTEVDTILLLAHAMRKQRQPLALHVTDPKENEHSVVIFESDPGRWTAEHFVTYQPNHPSADADDMAEWNSMGLLTRTPNLEHALKRAYQAVTSILHGIEPSYATVHIGVAQPNARAEHLSEPESEA